MDRHAHTEMRAGRDGEDSVYKGKDVTGPPAIRVFIRCDPERAGGDDRFITGIITISSVCLSIHALDNR